VAVAVAVAPDRMLQLVMREQRYSVNNTIDNAITANFDVMLFDLKVLLPLLICIDLLLKITM